MTSTTRPTGATGVAVVALAALAITGILLSGCGSDGPAGSADPSTPNTGGGASSAVSGPLMRHPARAAIEEGLAAEVRGVLELDGDCLYLSIAEIGERYPVIWPAATEWDEQRQTIVLPTGDEIAVGESALGGGGFYYADDVGDIAGGDAEALARQCVDNTYGEIAVVNNDDTAIAPG